ncbi:MAG: DUF362 domain-containing protein [Candidatus Omnitrophota bacterium]
MEKSRVAIVRVENYKKETVANGLDALLEMLGGLKKIIPPATRRILIKPNLMCGERWDTGITVNLDLLTHLIKLIQNPGFNFIVGEGVGWGVSSQDAFEKCGAKRVFEELRLPLYDFKSGRTTEVKIPGKKLKKVVVAEEILGCDFIISVAKLKTHCETVASLSLKNMKGIVARDQDRLAFHLLDVNQCLVDLNKVFKPDLAIVEGLIGLEGIGPFKPGRPKDLGILIAGKDPVAVDSTCCRIMRLNPEEVKHIKLAGEQGLGKIDPGDIEVSGERLEEVTPESFEKPPLTIEGISPYKEIKVVAGNPCSNCVAGLASYLHGYLRKEVVGKSVRSIKILIGARAKARLTGDEIALGNCLKRYQGKIPFCPGCPPPSDVYLKLVEDGLQGNLKSE